MTLGTITIIGAGNVGGALGRGWSRAGYDIVYGVVDPEDSKYKDVARQAGNAKIGTVENVSALANTIVLAIPWSSAENAIRACGDLNGKTIIDATNPLTVKNEALQLALGFATSGAEELAKLAQGAHLFKAMNQVGFAVMSDTNRYPSRPVMFIAGDDDSRKTAVTQLVADLGFDARDAGPLQSARLLEPYAMLWIQQALIHNAPDTSAFSFMKKGSKQAVVEYIRYELVSHSPEELVSAYTEAVTYLEASEHCLGYQLSQCGESSTHFILTIDWKSPDEHMVGFRGSKQFPPFLELVRPFIEEISEMRHYHPTDLNWVR